MEFMYSPEYNLKISPVKSPPQYRADVSHKNVIIKWPHDLSSNVQRTLPLTIALNTTLKFPQNPPQYRADVSHHMAADIPT